MRKVIHDDHYSIIRLGSKMITQYQVFDGWLKMKHEYNERMFDYLVKELGQANTPDGYIFNAFLKLYGLPCKIFILPEGSALLSNKWIIKITISEFAEPSVGWKSSIFGLLNYWLPKVELTERDMRGRVPTNPGACGYGI